MPRTASVTVNVSDAHELRAVLNAVEDILIHAESFDSETRDHPAFTRLRSAMESLELTVRGVPARVLGPDAHLHNAGLDGDPQVQPDLADIESPEFQAVWEVIKRWDIQRSPGGGYAHSTGTDVMAILNALKGASV